MVAEYAIDSHAQKAADEFRLLHIPPEGHPVEAVEEGDKPRVPLRIVEVDRGDCLLYTPDAAGERSRVDLGGRRII